MNNPNLLMLVLGFEPMTASHSAVTLKPSLVHHLFHSATGEMINMIKFCMYTDKVRESSCIALQLLQSWTAWRTISRWSGILLYLGNKPDFLLHRHSWRNPSNANILGEKHQHNGRKSSKEIPNHMSKAVTWAFHVGERCSFSAALCLIQPINSASNISGNIASFTLIASFYLDHVILTLY